MKATISQRILQKLSVAPTNSPVKKKQGKRIRVDNALDNLNEVFTGFEYAIKGKRILDFGCGWGYQAVAFAKAGAKEVVGVDSDMNGVMEGRKLAKNHNVDGMVSFKSELEGQDFHTFDIVISQNSMEHFPDPKAIMDILNESLTPSGALYITFGPPWFAPYGSHMRFFTKCPWVNILFSEETVMAVRQRYRNDGAMKYEDVDNGLNKMTVKKFENLLSEFPNLKVEYKRYDCIKKLSPLGMLPGIRELFINRVNCVLRNHP